jgi:hypothetical protein
MNNIRRYTLDLHDRASVWSSSHSRAKRLRFQDLTPLPSLMHSFTASIQRTRLNPTAAIFPIRMRIRVHLRFTNLLP